jgi:hypothetical protein
VPPSRVLVALDGPMNSWAGLAAVVGGIAAQGFSVEPKQFREGWRANFYRIGIAHSGGGRVAVGADTVGRGTGGGVPGR